jgi:hypothetical protein
MGSLENSPINKLKCIFEQTTPKKNKKRCVFLGLPKQNKISPFAFYEVKK